MHFKKTVSFLLAAYSTSAFADTDPLDREIIDLQQVNITASPFALKQEDLVISSHSLSDHELNRAIQSSLGATLENQPGITSTAYAPGASRPIIRGLGGDRVRILQNGTDTFDVSFTSPDHGVSVEPLLTERIEIVHGPASLLYGNAAIGGVVNVIDKSMPTEPVNGIEGTAEARGSSVSDETVFGTSIQGGDGNFAWSIGYVKRDAEDYDIPGYAESAFQRELEAHEDEDEHHDEEEHEEGEEEGEHEEGEDHDHEHEEEVFGTLENSFMESESLSLGLSWFGEGVTYGLAFNQYDSFYGVPGHAHAHEDEHDEEGQDEGEEGHDEDEEGHDEEEGEHDDEHGEEEESVVIDLKKQHFSFRAEWINPIDFFESIELDIGYGDYEHTELEGTAEDREVGTQFFRDGFDLRLVGIHEPIDNLTGAWGFHAKEESFEAIGEEAFVPSNDLSSYALFAVERLQTDWGAIEFGGRIENQSISQDDNTLGDADETTYNLSFGTITRMQDDSIVAFNMAYNERAPNAAELYAFGPHAGTQSFEIGNADLDIEASINTEVSWRKSVGFVTGEITAYYSDFKNFVYLEHLEEEVFETLYPDADSDGLDILIAEAVDAEFYGVELDVSFHIIDTMAQRLHFSVLMDQTRATNQTENNNLPRIPTRRIGARLDYEIGAWTMGAGARYHSKARHLAPDESPSESYTLAEADISYRFEAGQSVIELFAVGRNLTDEEARPNTSFVKDLVPLPGRNVELGARLFF